MYVSIVRRMAWPTRNWNAAIVSPPGKLVPNGSPSHQPVPYALDVIVERHPVAIGAGIVLAEPGILDDRQVADGRSDDLGGLPGPGVLAADQHVGVDLAADRQAVAKPFGLLAPQCAKVPYTCADHR